MSRKTQSQQRSQQAIQTDSLTNRQCVELFTALTQIGGVSGNFRFTYAAGRNRKTLEPIVDSIKSAGAPPIELAEYDKERADIARKYAIKGADGQTLLSTDGMFRVRETDEFKADMAALNEKFPGAEAKLADYLQRFEAWLESEVEPGVILAKCSPDALPDLPVSIVSNLLHMLEEPLTPVPAAQPNGMPPGMMMSAIPNGRR